MIAAIAAALHAFCLGRPPVFAAGEDHEAAGRKDSVLKSRIEKHLKQARIHYNDGEYGLAIYEWHIALSLDPGNQEIRGYINDAEEKLAGKREEIRKVKAPRVEIEIAPERPAEYPQALRIPPEEDREPLSAEEPLVEETLAEEALAEELKEVADKYREVEELRLQEDIEAIIEAGIAYYNSEDYKSAIEEWKRALELEPEDERIRNYMWDAEDRLVEQLRDMEEEIRVMEAQRTEDRINASLEKAREFYDRKDYRSAIEEWKRAISLDTTNKKARRYLEKAQRILARMIEEKEKEAREKIRKINKKKIDIHLKKARAYYDKRDYRTAIKEYGRALVLDSGNTKIKGYIQKAEQEIAKIIERKEGKAVEMVRLVLKDKISTHIDNARQFAENGDHNMALEEYKQAMALDPQDGQLKQYIQDTELMIASGKDTGAEEIKEKARKLLREKVDLYIDEGHAAFSNKDYKAALRVWYHAFSLDPGNEQTEKLIEKAKTRLVRQMQAKDEKTRERIERSTREKIEAHLKDAHGHLSRQDYKKAIAEYGKALSLDPENKRVRRFLKETKAKFAHKVKKEQRDLAAEPYETLRDEAEGHINRARAYRDIGNYNAALAEYGKALALEPGNMRIHGYIEDTESKIVKLTEKKVRTKKKAKIRVFRAEEKDLAGPKINDHLWKASEYMFEEKYEPAIDEYNRALALDPKNQRIKKYIRNAARRMAGQKQKKELAVERMKISKDIDAYCKSGQRYFDNKEYAAALDEWERALAFDPDSERAQTYVQKGRDALAMIGEREERKREKRQSEAEGRIRRLAAEHLRKGKRHYVNKEYEAALKEWQLACEMDPDNHMARGYIRKVTNKLMAAEGKEQGKVILKLTDHMPGDRDILTIDECVDIAIKNSIALNVAKKQAKLAEMKVWEARRNFLGKVSLRWDSYKGRVSGERYDGRKYIFDIQQPVYKGGETFFLMRQADVNNEVVKSDYERIKNELILKVKKACYTLAKSIENYNIQEELLGEIAGIIDRVERLNEEGFCTRTEYLNVQSQRVQTDFSHISAKQDIKTARLILQQAMSIEPDTKIEIIPNFELKTVEDISLKKCMKLAMANRPEMKINNLMVEYYGYEKKIYKAKDYPSIDAMASFGNAGEWFSHEHPNFPRNSPRLGPQWYAGLKVKVPMFGSTSEYSLTKEEWPAVVSTLKGTRAETHSVQFRFLDDLKVYTGMQESDIEYDRAKQEYEKTSQDITLEVNESFYGYKKSILQIEVASAKMDYQQQELEFSKLRRGLDEVQDSVVIESTIRLSQERFGRIHALTDYFIAICTLNKSIGIEDYFKIDQ
ncbi:tetratricopeptide repeat protein [Candidatus Omnitrophota bacterium]